MVGVNRTPLNQIPEEWAFHPQIGPFIRALLQEVYQSRERTGGDFDQVEWNTHNPVIPFSESEAEAPESIGPPQVSQAVPDAVPAAKVEAEAIDDMAAMQVAQKALSVATEALKGIVPIGAIVAWSGAIPDIPDGFQLCDGTGVTDDLTASFIIHADADSGGTYNVDDTGNAEAAIPASGIKYFAKAYIQRIE